MLFEKNTKENETFIHYIQWNDNEEALKLLEKVLNMADYDDIYGGDIVMLSLSTKIHFTEDAVNQHCAVKDDLNSYYSMFTKYNGKFKCPFNDDDTLENPFAIAEKIQYIFYSCNIRTMFE
jgi:hypothetical protein